MTRPRVGIVGAGQLGRMLALAGYPLGIDCTLLDTSRNAPVGGYSAGGGQDAFGPEMEAKFDSFR